MYKLRAIFFTLSFLVLGLTLEPRTTMASGAEAKGDTAVSTSAVNASATPSASMATDGAAMANSETQKQKKAAAKMGEQQAKASKPKMDSGY